MAATISVWQRGREKSGQWSKHPDPDLRNLPPETYPQARALADEKNRLAGWTQYDVW